MPRRCRAERRAACSPMNIDSSCPHVRGLRLYASITACSQSLLQMAPQTTPRRAPSARPFQERSRRLAPRCAACRRMLSSRHRSSVIAHHPSCHDRAEIRRLHGDHRSCNRPAFLRAMRARRRSPASRSSAPSAVGPTKRNSGSMARSDMPDGKFRTIVRTSGLGTRTRNHARPRSRPARLGGGDADQTLTAHDAALQGIAIS